MTLINGKCNLCDTQVEHVLDDGGMMKFLRHDAVFCELMTLDKIALLTRMYRDEQISHATTREWLQRVGHLADIFKDAIERAKELERRRGRPPQEVPVVSYAPHEIDVPQCRICGKLLPGSDAHVCTG